MANENGIIPQLTDAMKHLTSLMANYPADILRSGISGAIAVERYHLTAHELGVSREDADALLDEARRELSESLWSFDPTAVARHRLMEQYAALLPPPAPEMREAARRFLLSQGDRFDPVDVDQTARSLEHWTKAPPG